MAVKPRCESARERILPPETDKSIAACPSMRPAIPRSACARACARSAGVITRRNSNTRSTIMTGPPMKLGKRELPAHQHPKDDAKLQHKVSRGEFERHGGDKVSALTEQGSSQSNCDVGTGGRGSSKSARN